MRTALVLAMALLATGSASGDDKLVPKYKGKELDYWIAKLERPADDKEMKEAAEAVKAFGPDAATALPKLLVMLEDKSDDYRRQVYLIIAEIKSAALPAVPVLAKRLKEKTATDPHTLLMILQHLGPSAGEAAVVVAGLLGDNEHRFRALPTQCAFGPDRAKPHTEAVIAALKADRACFHHISGLKAVIVPGLVAWLEKEEDDETAESLVRNLGDIGPDAKAAIPLLKKKLLTQEELNTIRKQREAMKNPVFLPLGPPGERRIPTQAELVEQAENRSRVLKWWKRRQLGYQTAIALATIAPCKDCLDTLIVMVGSESGSDPWSVEATRILGEMGKLAALALPALQAKAGELLDYGDVSKADHYLSAIAAIKKAMAEK